MVWWQIDGSYTYCGEHFLMHINVNSLCCTPETYIHYTSIKEKWRKNYKEWLKMSFLFLLFWHRHLYSFTQSADIFIKVHIFIISFKVCLWPGLECTRYQFFLLIFKSMNQTICSSKHECLPLHFPILGNSVFIEGIRRR